MLKSGASMFSGVYIGCKEKRSIFCDILLPNIVKKNMKVMHYFMFDCTINNNESSECLIWSKLGYKAWIRTLNLVIHGLITLGKDGCAKSDEFSEKIQTAFNPTPLIFGKSYFNFFGNATFPSEGTVAVYEVGWLRTKVLQSWHQQLSLSDPCPIIALPF